ncbi:Uncharacterized protein APZ42_007149, partial [Daphnia magna]
GFLTLGYYWHFDIEQEQKFEIVPTSDCTWIYTSFKLGFLTLGYYWHFDIEQEQNFEIVPAFD